MNTEMHVTCPVLVNLRTYPDLCIIPSAFIYIKYVRVFGHTSKITAILGYKLNIYTLASV